MLRALDPGKQNVPIWFTEIGIELSAKDLSPLAEARQAATLVKIYTLSLAQGISQISWFDPRDSEGKHHGLLRRDGSRRPAHRVLSALTRALGDKPQWRGFVDLGPSSYGFLFRGKSDEVLVAWARPDARAKAELSWPDSVALTDSASGAQRAAARIPLTTTPLLLQAAAESKTAVAWRAKASTAIPASWLCRAPGVTVQLIAGEPPCGLHMIDMPAAQGGKELSLAGRSVAKLAVDPQLIGYGDRALEITAVVRGHGKVKGGFNLKYEADRPLDRVDDNGMVGAGSWNHVQGDKPTTLRWQIKDARFVGKYGFNLAIDCDSRKYCDFSLLRLSVRKL
jgi:hypothetical protein